MGGALKRGEEDRQTEEGEGKIKEADGAGAESSHRALWGGSVASRGVMSGGGGSAMAQGAGSARRVHARAALCPLKVIDVSSSL